MSRSDKRYGSPRWRKLTRDIQARDLWKCQYCGRPSALADHVLRADLYPHLFWDPGNLVGCCRSCNQGRRQNGDAWVPPNRRTRAPNGPERRPVAFRPAPIKPRIW